VTRYNYKAADRLGEVVEGQLEAASESDAARRLQDSGLVPVWAEAAGTSRLAKFLSIEVLPSRGGLSHRDVAEITRQLTTLFGAGIELEKALEIVSSLGRKKDVRQTLSRILDDVRSGSTLADALSGANYGFSPLYVSLVRSGEASGSLAAVFSGLADFLEQSQKVREEIKSALVYPAILLISATASIMLLIGFVLPQFRPLFEGAGERLPPMTRFIMTAGDFIEAYWWVGVAGTCAAVLLFRTLLRSPPIRERWDLGLLRLPLAGTFLAKKETSRLARTLGTLLINGVPAVSAFEIARDTVTNRAYSVSLVGVFDGIKAGRRLSEGLERLTFFPQLARHLVRVGEESGQLAAMLLRTAEIYDEEIRRSVQRFISMMTPAVTLVLGVLVGGIIVSILMAILSVNELAF